MQKIAEEQKPSTIGERIYACMKQHNISMRALSNKLAISQPSVFKWSHDQATPKIEQIEAMAALFGVTPEWLAFGRADAHEHDAGADAGLEAEIFGLSVGISEEVARTRFGVGSKDLLILPVQSDEMSPTLNKEDIVIVDRTLATANTSGVYAIALGSDYVIRRVQRLFSGGLKVICDNKNYGDEHLDNPDALRIIGKVVSKLNMSAVH